MPSIALPVSLRGQLLSGSRFNPISLFSAGEQGIWLDPSDVANLDWRRNLLTYTEQFDNAVWYKDGATVTTNTTTAPDSMMTADGIVATNRLLWFDNTGFKGLKTQSIYAKANLGSTLAITAIGGQSVVGGYSVIVNLTTGLVTSGQVSPNVIVTDTGNGWWRISILTYVDIASGNSTYWMIGPTSGIYIWGAQLELGSVATEYQRISDVNTEVVERFPSATLYQDRAGTTPVTTPGQTVGLRLDKSKGLVLGSELVTNGDFSSDTWWTKGAGATISGGKANFSASSGYVLNRLGVSGIVTGGYYEVTFTVSDYVSGSIRPYLGSTPTFGTAVTANGTYTARFSPGSGTEVGFNSASAFTGSIDNVSIKAITGNHAVAPTDAARPTYGIEPKTGRRNLLTRTEEFGDAVWQKITSGVGVAPVLTSGFADPDGTSTAWRLQINAGANGASDYSLIRQSSSSWPDIGTRSIWLRSNTGSNQTVTLVATNVNFRVTVTPTWQRFESASSVGAKQLDVSVGGAGSTGATADILIWHPQFEDSATATTYQRVGTAFDVTEAGVPTVHYVQYDGTDDSFSTSSIDFSATDKMSVFAGVMKLSDAAAGILVELSNNVSNNTGSLYVVTGPDPFVSTRYSSGTRGSTLFTITSIAQTNIGNAPDQAVLSTTHDIAGDLTTIRRNGVVGTSSTADLGTGNFGNYPLFIGRRNNATLPFNGRDYGVIIVGKTASASEIYSTESYLAANTSGVSI